MTGVCHTRTYTRIFPAEFLCISCVFAHEYLCDVVLVIQKILLHKAIYHLFGESRASTIANVRPRIFLFMYI